MAWAEHVEPIFKRGFQSGAELDARALVPGWREVSYQRQAFSALLPSDTSDRSRLLSMHEETLNELASEGLKFVLCVHTAISGTRSVSGASLTWTSRPGRRVSASEIAGRKCFTMWQCLTIGT